MSPFLASIMAAAVLLATKVTTAAAGVAPMLGEGAAGFDLGWIEKVGTVGVCIWMLVWFQRRNEDQRKELVNLTERAITALEKNSESMREVAAAVKRP